MDVFNLDGVMSEKATAMRRFLRVRSLTRLLRLVELSSTLALISWLSTHLPFAVKISGEYFKIVLSLIVSPVFMFIVGNAIVLTLFMKSGKYSCSGDNVESEFYESLRSNASDSLLELKKEEQTEEVVFQDKEMIHCEVKKPPKPAESEGEDPAAKSIKVEGDLEVFKVYRRSQSENLMWKFSEEKVMHGKKLRRSDTDICCQKYGDAGEELGDRKDFLEDGMSNEEFRKKIEAFIAKQVKFHRQESLAVVLHTQA